MEKRVVIDVRNVVKHFKVYEDKGTSLKEKVIFSNRRRYEKREVLKGISFQVKKGETIGLIGRNGCGKSTMLKMLTRILYPDGGSVKLDGRVSALIELGAGFHPDMTGRENIYINASIFGLTKKETDERLQTIIDFSELGDYIDNPVRTYSSGMYMRLAFSVAINVNADILLIDEILAVGDTTFQLKCFDKLRELKAKGITIIIVSHALEQIDRLCDRVLWIYEGNIRMDGAPQEVMPVYLGKVKSALEEGCDMQARTGTGDVRFTSVRLLNENGEEPDAFATDKPMTVVMDYAVKRPAGEAVFTVDLYRADGIRCYCTSTQLDGEAPVELRHGGTVAMRIERNVLLAGVYTLDVRISGLDGTTHDSYRYAKRFAVYSDRLEEGIARLPHAWEIWSR